MSNKCHCGGSILQKSSDGSVKLRLDGPITIGPDGLAKARCYWCREPITLPVELKKSAIPSPAPERLVIPAKKK